MFAQRTGGIREEFKCAPTEFESMAQDATDTPLEEPCPVDIAVPAVSKAIFVTELHADEAFGESRVTVLILPDDAVRLSRIRSFEKYPRGGDDDVVTRDMSWSKTKWFDRAMDLAHALETLFRVFVHFSSAHLEGH